MGSLYLLFAIRMGWAALHPCWVAFLISFEGMPATAHLCWVDEQGGGAPKGVGSEGVGGCRDEHQKVAMAVMAKNTQMMPI